MAMSSFNRAYTTSYSPFIETIHLSWISETVKATQSNAHRKSLISFIQQLRSCRLSSDSTHCWQWPVTMHITQLATSHQHQAVLPTASSSWIMTSFLRSVDTATVRFCCSSSTCQQQMSPSHRISSHSITHARTHARTHACTHTRMHARAHTHTTVLRLSGLCLRQPGWACTRRNIHPLTRIVVIGHPLSASSIYYDIRHSACTIYMPGSLFHNLSPTFLWSASWTGILHFKLHSFLVM